MMGSQVLKTPQRRLSPATPPTMYHAPASPMATLMAAAIVTMNSANPATDRSHVPGEIGRYEMRHPPIMNGHRR